MADFGEAAGPFISSLIRSLQEEAERLSSMVKALGDSDPTPQQIGNFAGKCVETVAKAVTDIAQEVREAAKTFHEPPPDFNVPDDLSDLG